jgi:hypothetical protein
MGSVSRRIVGITCAVAIALAIHGDRPAGACIGGEETILESTAFDPAILGDTYDGLYFNPFSSGFGGMCTQCLDDAVLADWAGYLPKLPKADLERLIFKTTAPELARLARRYDDKMKAALAVLELARRVEITATFSAPPPADLLVAAKAGLATADDPFIAQRYAFLALRIQFYTRDWANAVAFHDTHAATLAGPSTDLAWRARHYLAGALTRSDRRARANLELARISAGYKPLAGGAALDFHPMEDKDWHATLALARDVREQTALWRMAGIKGDPIAAIDEIRKLDPKSDLFALLVVRELNRVESMLSRFIGEGDAASAQTKAFAALEQRVRAIAATPGADRPWLMHLVLGHIAAKQHDRVHARVELQQAVAARPGDKAVAMQARASLAMALAGTWQHSPFDEQELAATFAAVGAPYERAAALRTEVRDELAAAYVVANKPSEAELLKPSHFNDFGHLEEGAVPLAEWQRVEFIKEMIAATARTTTAFDRFVATNTHKRSKLEQELALRYMLDSDFAAAARTFQTTRAESTLLHTDPFVMHVRDCRDCDMRKYASAPWTHASLAARLAELAHVASGTGDTAAEAALAIGNVLYNVTFYGNARVALRDTHQSTRDTTASERWYKRAFDLATKRDLKAKAAFFAAKAERGARINRELELELDHTDPAFRTPHHWFEVMKGFADTAYYKEAFRECGYFADWIDDH